MRAIVEIARKYNVWLIEDFIYGSPARRRPSHAGRAGAGADLPRRRPVEGRVGGRARRLGLPARAHFAPRVQTAHKMVTGGMPFMLARTRRPAGAVAARPARSAPACKAEIAAREELARRHFAGLDFASHPDDALSVDEAARPWLSGTFKKVAARRRRAGRRRGRVQGRPLRAGLPPHPRQLSPIPKSREEVAAGFADDPPPASTAAASGYDSYG